MTCCCTPNNSANVQTWSVIPASIAGVTRSEEGTRFDTIYPS